MTTADALNSVRPIELSISLGALDLQESEKHWPRTSIDGERVDTYADAMRDPNGGMYLFPRISIVPHPYEQGRYLVADGMHRARAHQKLVDEGMTGYDAIDAQLYPLGTDPYLLAMRAFGTGTLPLKDSEKGPNIDRLLKAYPPPKMSTRDIARLAGASQTYVVNRKKRLDGDTTPEKVNTVFTPTPKVATVATPDPDDDDDYEGDRPGWMFLDMLIDLRDNTATAGIFGLGAARSSPKRTAAELVGALDEVEADEARGYVGLLEHFSEASRLAIKMWAQRT